jgi:hypothetical protein
MNKMLKSKNSCVSSAMGYVEEGFSRLYAGFKLRLPGNTGWGQGRDSLGFFREDRIRMSKRPWRACDREKTGTAAPDPPRLFTRIVCSDDLRREYRLGAFSVGQIIRCRAHARLSRTTALRGRLHLSHHGDPLRRCLVKKSRICSNAPKSNKSLCPPR